MIMYKPSEHRKSSWIFCAVIKFHKRFKQNCMILPIAPYK